MTTEWPSPGLVLACHTYQAVTVVRVSRKSFLEALRQLEIFLTGFRRRGKSCADDY